MMVACDVIGLTSNKNKVREWIRELQSYGMIKIEEKKDREPRITLMINSEEIKGCVEGKEKYLRCFVSKPTTNPVV